MLKFKFFFFLPLSLILPSCSLRTQEESINFLFSNYSLWHAYTYVKEDMEKHNFIEYDKSRSLDYIFPRTNKLEFYYNKDINKPYFNLTYQEKNYDAINIYDINYSLKLENFYFGKITVESSFYLFSLQNVTTYPNYWVRIHFQKEIDGNLKDIILEYKRDSSNSI